MLIRNLAQSRILLLIIGDGIREGVEAIADYVQSSPALHFTLALVEARSFEIAPGTRIVQPRVLARTVIINRTVVGLASPSLQIQDGDQSIEEPADDKVLDGWQRYMFDFWTELLTTLKLDDADQPIAKATADSKIYFQMPLMGQIWLDMLLLAKRTANWRFSRVTSNVFTCN